MVDKLKLNEEKKSLITIKETDIFKAENLDLTGVHVVVSCLGFHRRNNKGMKIDHYTRSMDSILTACKTHRKVCYSKMHVSGALHLNASRAKAPYKTTP